MSVRGSSQHRSGAGGRSGRSTRPAPGAVLLLAGLSALLPFSARALDPALDVAQYAHTAWKARDGAFRGNLVSIAQTTDGYLWLGTGFGLLRYDGARFVPWEPPPGSKLPGPQIGKVHGARDGSLWIGGRGLARLRQGELRAFPELDGVEIQAIVEDRDGVIWAGGIRRPTTRLCAIRADAVRCAGDGGEFGEWVRSLYVDRRNQLWVGSAQGVVRWSPGPPRRFPDAETRAIANDFAEDEGGNLLVAAGLALRRVVGDHIEGLDLSREMGSVRALSLLRDRDGALWIGTDDNGLVHVRNGRVDRYAPPDGLSSATPLDLFEDREGNVWAATLHGLDRFREFAVPSLTTRQGLASDHISSVLAARDGSLWVAGPNGLSRRHEGKWTRYGEAEGLPSDVAASLFEDRQGRIWASTGRPGLARFKDGRFRAAPPGPTMFAFQIVEDAAGNLWTSTRDAGLTRYDGEGNPLESFPLSALGGSSALSLAPDPRRGGLWLGFSRGGIARFEGGEIRERYGVEEGLGEGQVRDLQLDAQGVLWASTQEGLSRLGGGRVATLGREGGLPCAAVHWMRSAGDDVWLYTECGLVRLGRADLAAWSEDPRRRVTVLDHLDHTDGVENVYYNGYYTPYVARAGDGRLYFSSLSGLGVLDPRRLARRPPAPAVLVELLVADGIAHAAPFGAAPLRLPPRLRDLRIDYTATRLGLPQKVRFRHRLEGLEGHGEAWQEAENRRQAFYQDLPPGDYSFHVVAANGAGGWSAEGAALAFTVLPAFHQTKTFLALLAALAALAVWGLYRWRVRQVTGRLAAQYEERIGERTRIARELHDTLLQGFLSASMQLSVAAGSLPREAPQRDQLDRIVVLVRRMIDEGRSAVAGLRATGTGSADLEERLARVPEEIGANEGVAFGIRERGRARPLAEIAGDEAYRIGREALVNACRHADPKNVEVEIAYGEEELRVRVKDDGSGFDPEAAGRGGHWGLAGMRERAERIGARLEVRSARGEGTEVELAIPAALAYRPEPEEPRRRAWWRFGRRRGMVREPSER